MVGGCSAKLGATAPWWDAALGGGGNRRRGHWEEAETGQVGRVGEKPNGLVGWLGQLGRNLKRILFRIKIRLLNIPRL
jgi:hypothetical protein